MPEILYRYKPDAVNASEADLVGHSGNWCSWCIADILKGMGYTLQLEHWTRQDYTGDKTFDAIFDVVYLYGLDKAIRADTVKMVHITGADLVYQHRVTLERIAQVKKMTGKELKPFKRPLLQEQLHEHLDRVDHLSVIGNEWTRSTFPERLQKRMQMVNAPASYNPNIEMRRAIPKERHFVWHNGGQSALKGLHLVLQAFRKLPNMHLHVVGLADPDFFEAYKADLTLAKNVHYHKWVWTSSSTFKEIMDKSFCQIAPSASDGMSPAVATCLQAGLYPAISRQTGITLPDGCGIYLDGDNVRDAIMKAYAMSDAELLKQVRVIQEDAMTRYSRKLYRETMTNHLRKCLCVN